MMKTFDGTPLERVGMRIDSLLKKKKLRPRLGFIFFFALLLEEK